MNQVKASKNENNQKEIDIKINKEDKRKKRDEHVKNELQKIKD